MTEVDDSELQAFSLATEMVGRAEHFLAGESVDDTGNKLVSSSPESRKIIASHLGGWLADQSIGRETRAAIGHVMDWTELIENRRRGNGTALRAIYVESLMKGIDQWLKSSESI